jgi:hypothetical protein
LYLMRTMSSGLRQQQRELASDRGNKGRSPEGITVYSPEQIISHATAAGGSAYATVIRAGRPVAIAESPTTGHTCGPSRPVGSRFWLPRRRRGWQPWRAGYRTRTAQRGRHHRQGLKVCASDGGIGFEPSVPPYLDSGLRLRRWSLAEISRCGLTARPIAERSSRTRLCKNRVRNRLSDGRKWIRTVGSRFGLREA